MSVRPSVRLPTRFLAAANFQMCHVAVAFCKLTTPGSIELDQDILLGVLGHLLKVLSDQDLDRLGVPSIGDLLGQEVLLETAGQEILDKGSDVGLGQGVVGGLELGHVLLQLDQSHAGQFGLAHAEEFQDPFVIFLVGVDGDEEDLALVVLGDLLGGGGLVGILVGLVADEHEKVVLDLAGEDFLGGLVVEVNEEGESGTGHKLGDLLDVGQVITGQVVAALVKLLEHDDGIAGDLEKIT